MEAEIAQGCTVAEDEDPPPTRNKKHENTLAKFTKDVTHDYQESHAEHEQKVQDYITQLVL